MMDDWFDHGVELGTVLKACQKSSGITNPNFNYLNTVITGWRKEENAPARRSGGDGGSGGRQQIAAVFRHYEQLRDKSKREAEARRQEVYTRVPAIKKLAEEIQRCRTDLWKIASSGADNAGNKTADLRKERGRLQSEKAFLMTENGFSVHYMETVYACAICRDTGKKETGERCACFARYLAELGKQNDVGS
jgi:hypothetical protein